MYKLGKTALVFLALAAVSFGAMTACDEGDQPHTGWEPQSSSSSSLVTDSSSFVDSSSESADVEDSSYADSSVEMDSSIKDDEDKVVTYTVSNPNSLECEEATLMIYKDGTFLLTCVETIRIEGVYTISNDEVYLLSGIVWWWNDNSEWEEDTEIEEGVFEVWGVLDGNNQTFTVTEAEGGSGSSEPMAGSVYTATNPEMLSGEMVQVIMWNDGSYELIVEVNTPDGLARMTITGVWTEWADGTIHFDALTAVQDYKGETTEDTSEDKKHWDVYGTLDRENGTTFTITGKGSTPPGGNGSQSGNISTGEGTRPNDDPTNN